MMVIVDGADKYWYLIKNDSGKWCAVYEMVHDKTIYGWSLMADADVVDGWDDSWWQFDTMFMTAHFRYPPKADPMDSVESRGRSHPPASEMIESWCEKWYHWNH